MLKPNPKLSGVTGLFVTLTFNLARLSYKITVRIPGQNRDWEKSGQELRVGKEEGRHGG